MKELIQELNEIKGVKNTKQNGDSILKINLFHKEIPQSDAVKIIGNLRKISPKIRNTLEMHRKNGNIQNWEWINKPEKQYTKTRLGRGKTTDRKEKGHKPGYYKVTFH